MANKSFTYMSKTGQRAIVDALPADGYEMRLNVTDMTNLLSVLAMTYGSSCKEADWCGEFISSVGETLGIEFV